MAEGSFFPRLEFLGYPYSDACFEKSGDGKTRKLRPVNYFPTLM